MSVPLVYTKIAAVSAVLAKDGIAKDRKNTQQGGGYNFRGIDDIYNALAPILAQHGLVIIPRVLNRAVSERSTKAGGVLFDVVVEAEFDFVAAEDGSVHTARTFGEAMDSGDKATNKAMSAAYKYVAFQTFCIPTEGDNDADATTHVVVATITESERLDLQALAQEHKWKNADVASMLKAKFHVESSKQLSRGDLPAVVRALQTGPVDDAALAAVAASAPY